MAPLTVWAAHSSAVAISSMVMPPGACNISIMDSCLVPLLTETDSPFLETTRGTVRPRDVKGTVVLLSGRVGFTAEDMRSGLISNLRELFS